MYVSAHIRVNVDPGFARKFAVDNSRTKIAAADRRIPVVEEIAGWLCPQCRTNLPDEIRTTPLSRVIGWEALSGDRCCKFEKMP